MTQTRPSGLYLLAVPLPLKSLCWGIKPPYGFWWGHTICKPWYWIRQWPWVSDLWVDNIESQICSVERESQGGGNKNALWTHWKQQGMMCSAFLPVWIHSLPHYVRVCYGLDSQKRGKCPQNSSIPERKHNKQQLISLTQWHFLISQVCLD
jgi:hypothetical protein